jgi:hypothetical protein
VLRAALDLPDDASITLAELACLEEDCAPVETVFGLLPASGPQLQHKVHKAADAIDAEDLMQVCKAWGYEVQITAFAPFIKEI